MSHQPTQTPQTTDRPDRGPMRRLRESFADARVEANERRTRRVRELQHDQRFDALRGLAMRRVLVAVGYLLAVTAAVLELRLDGLVGVAAPLVFLLGLGIAFMVHRTVRNAVDAPDEALDERLVALRDAAHRTAYRAVLWPTLAMLFAVMLAAGPDSVTLEPRHLQALVWAFALVVALTPSAVLAWRERQV